MTKDEALKLALEALENMSAALREDDVLGSDSELVLNAITAIKEALDECDADAIIIQYHEATIKWLEKRIAELTAQPAQKFIDHKAAEFCEKQFLKPSMFLRFVESEERNFCPRCGKRTADLTTIHTCTPPQTIAEEHFAKFDSDINLAVNKAMVEDDDDIQDYKKPWVGLTTNELQPIADEYRFLFGSWVEDFARVIEAKLKEKNA